MAGRVVYAEPQSLSQSNSPQPLLTPPPTPQLTFEHLGGGGVLGAPPNDSNGYASHSYDQSNDSLGHASPRQHFHPKFKPSRFHAVR